MHNIRSHPILLFQNMPQVNKWFFRSLEEHCKPAGLTLPVVYIAGRYPVVESDLVKWVDVAKATEGGSPQFAHLRSLKIACDALPAGPVEINYFPSFTMGNICLPVASAPHQIVECATCRGGGINTLTLRKLQNDKRTHYLYDLGTPWVADTTELSRTINNMPIPYAIETYYNNMRSLRPAATPRDGVLVLNDARWIRRTPEQISMELLRVRLLVLMQSSWSRWTHDFLETRWPNPSAYEEH